VVTAENNAEPAHPDLIPWRLRLFAQELPPRAER